MLLFKQRAVTQLGGIFCKYKSNGIRSLLVSWHAHYVVNLKVIGDILLALDSGNLAMLSLLDLSAAFDTV